MYPKEEKKPKIFAANELHVVSLYKYIKNESMHEKIKNIKLGHHDDQKHIAKYNKKWMWMSFRLRHHVACSETNWQLMHDDEKTFQYIYEIVIIFMLIFNRNIINLLIKSEVQYIKIRNENDLWYNWVQTIKQTLYEYVCVYIFTNLHIYASYFQIFINVKCKYNINI